MLMVKRLIEENSLYFFDDTGRNDLHERDAIGGFIDAWVMPDVSGGFNVRVNFAETGKREHSCSWYKTANLSDAGQIVLSDYKLMGSLYISNDLEAMEATEWLNWLDGGFRDDEYDDDEDYN